MKGPRDDQPCLRLPTCHFFGAGVIAGAGGIVQSKTWVAAMATTGLFISFDRADLLAGAVGGVAPRAEVEAVRGVERPGLRKIGLALLFC